VVSSIASKLQAVKQRIETAAQQAGREQNEIQLIAVSKTHPAEAIRAAYEAGQRVFGESYVQEALDKIAQLASLNIEWHFIGPIQSNKTRAIANAFNWVHSVDRLKIAQRLSEQRAEELPALNICVQINISGESTKSGVSVDELPALVEAIALLPRLRLRGLMAIPQPEKDVSKQGLPFAQLRQLLAGINEQCKLQMDTLSMGMSDDMDVAIAEGATMVRVGTDIFGQRDYRR